jgi:hypothetical protein
MPLPIEKIKEHFTYIQEVIHEWQYLKNESYEADPFEYTEEEMVRYSGSQETPDIDLDA